TIVTGEPTEGPTGEPGDMITGIKLREGAITKALPADDIVKNDFFSVLVDVINTSDIRDVFYLDCVITKPSGATTGRIGERQTLDQDQKHTYQIQPEGFGIAFRVDETGDWYVQCDLRTEDGIKATTGVMHLFTAGSEGATSDLQVYDLEAELPSAHPILSPLDTLEIGVTFKYTAVEDTVMQLWASLSIATGRDIEA
ncbi:unnamed protein product, partial [marine sediment metagenome]